MNAIGKVERGREGEKIGKLLDHLNAKCARTETRGAQKKGDKMYGSAIWRIFRSLYNKKIYSFTNVLTYLRQGIIFWLIYLSFVCKTQIVNFWRIKYQQAHI